MLTSDTFMLGLESHVQSTNDEHHDLAAGVEAGDVKNRGRYVREPDRSDNRNGYYVTHIVDKNDDHPLWPTPATASSYCGTSLAPGTRRTRRR